MKYSSVNQLINDPDSIEAINYLKELWYAIEENIFSLSMNDQTYNHQFIHLRAGAPENWNLNWDGKEFSLTKSIRNHGMMRIISQANGHITFKFI